MFRLYGWLSEMFHSVQNETLKTNVAPLKVNDESLAMLQRLLSKQVESPVITNQIERKELARIRQLTRGLNLNNVTRTMAYLQFFNQNPEVHWAFLAHMVSRNGGWNMTDLKGSLLTSFMSKSEQISYFSFLEKANALIFSDAYPQLLLYELAKEKGPHLFSHLRLLNVSCFMEAVWRTFMHTGDRAFLTIGLIINEQHFIEKPVLLNPIFKTNVLETWQYQLQDLFQLTQVIFPYMKSGKIRLSGLDVNQFRQVSERIKIGKKLYTILFGVKEMTDGTIQFAKERRHTGSREDYWPQVFSKNENKIGDEKRHSCRSNGAPFIYSPTLSVAWSNQEVEETGRIDWYKGKDVLDYFSTQSLSESIDITEVYCESLNHMMVIKKAKSKLFRPESEE
ncbi:DUF2515 family protein [Alteribacter aurantiacus]|uniref:DUF2515 family protein n=1 Tax=Alteribacter aurantiacus TaxID=254410 RepID=UPI000424A586|nr:DUF2515 family protein [Alteribacter aurantiacus]